MPKSRKTFDCVEQKRKAQERIYEQIRGLDHRQEIAYFDRAVQSGPLADFWRRLTAGASGGERGSTE